MTDLDMDEEKLRSNISAFEAALAARQTTIGEPPVLRILFALDGSNQDDTALRLVSFMARRTGATVLPICAWETTDSSRAAYLQEQEEQLRAAGAALESAGAIDDVRPPYMQILAAAQAADCDLIVVSAPYRDDFAVLGHDSVGTTLDLLLCRAPRSLLVVRAPKEAPENCFAKILLPISPRLAASAEAAGWAVRLAQKEGLLQILIVTERDVPAKNAAPPSAPEAQVQAIEDPQTAGLIAALQRRASDLGLACRVDQRHGEEVATIVKAEKADDLLLVLPCCPRDPSGPTYQRVQALIRLAGNPVLMI